MVPEPWFSTPSLKICISHCGFILFPASQEIAVQLYFPKYTVQKKKSEYTFSQIICLICDHHLELFWCVGFKLLCRFYGFKILEGALTSTTQSMLVSTVGRDEWHDFGFVGSMQKQRKNLVKENMKELGGAGLSFEEWIFKQIILEQSVLIILFAYSWWRERHSWKKRLDKNHSGHQVDAEICSSWGC